jgi:SecD/SecF fusion protein
MTRLIFDYCMEHNWLHDLSMFRLLSKTNINFMAIRYYWFTATVILTILGGTLFIMRDKAGLNIDFTGGTAYSGELKKPLSLEGPDGLRALLKDSKLPELSVEQIFISAPGYTEGDKSKLFTVRTPLSTDDSVQVVKNAIDRCLGKGEDGKGPDLLKIINLGDYQVKPDGKGVTLSFTDPDTKQPAFASRAQVSMLLARELKAQGMETQAQGMALEGLGKDYEGRFQWMDARFLEPVDKSKLTAALDATRRELAKPQPERLEKFDAQLAGETQLRALYAILASWGAILLYLWFRFGNWTFGAATVLCLIHDLFFTLGAIAACHYIVEAWPSLGRALLLSDFKIDLPAIAALLTLVGYSVSDTIVVFDRIREVRGKNPELTPKMINDSVNQTLSRTILASMSVWLVVIVLYVFGGEGVHLFGFVMVIGVIVGTYSSIYIASPLLLIFGEGAQAASQQRARETASVGGG